MLKKLIAATAFATLAPSVSAQTFDAAAFYKGKNVSILVASSTGGGLDTYARLVSRHFQKHIPGAPVDSGHFLTEEAPDATAKALREFFTS